MERAGNEDYDEDTEKKGLGTPATRAATIEALVKNGYVERVGKQLRATDKGKELVTVVPDEVKSAKLTAEWESKLQQIEHGSLPEVVFMSGITQFITEMCSKYGSVDKSVSLSDGGNEPIEKCPKCGADVVKGKFGFYCKGKCGMNIAKVYGVELSDAQVKGLLDGKSTSYTSKGKKTIVRPEIVENPYNVEIVEAEAAQLPNVRQDVDYAVINSNYAINAGLNPLKDALAIEGSSSAYGNILCVKEGNENEPKILALKAALESKQVADFITEKYAGSVVSTVTNPTDGYDASADYAALNGTTISVAASPTPHAEILEVAKTILAAKGITLDIQSYNDYVVPNTVVEDGTVDANYFQHLPYLEDFNKEQGTHIVSIATIHVEPMGLYGGKQTSLDALTK